MTHESPLPEIGAAPKPLEQLHTLATTNPTRLQRLIEAIYQKKSLFSDFGIDKDQPLGEKEMDILLDVCGASLAILDEKVESETGIKYANPHFVEEVPESANTLRMSANEKRSGIQMTLTFAFQTGGAPQMSPTDSGATLYDELVQRFYSLEKTKQEQLRAQINRV